MKPQRSNKRDAAQIKTVSRLLVVIFAVLFVLSGFEHYEKTGAIGMTAAYIVFGILALGWAALSFLDERREKIRKEKLEDAERIAKILAAPLDKYDNNDEAVEKVLEALEKKYDK